MSETRKLMPGEVVQMRPEEFERMKETIPSGKATPNLNPSGVKPFDKAVLVRMDEPYDEVETDLPKNAGGMPLKFLPENVARQRMAQTKGGVIVTEDEREKKRLAQINGLVVAVGVNAFSEAKREAESRGVKCDTPEPGTRVTLARYEGVMISSEQTKDGNQYRLVNDESIVAILEDE